MTSPGLIAAMRSAPHWVSPTMPSRHTPTPKCAIAVPQAERGRPAARPSTAANGTRKRPVRSATSVSAPAMTKKASPTTNGASTGPPPATAKAAAMATIATASAAVRRCATPKRSPRFQASDGRVEERRADGNLVAGQRLERERVERTDEHGRADRREEQIVEQQRPF